MGARLGAELGTSRLGMFHGVYLAALAKFSKHWDSHHAHKVYQQLRVFDPRNNVRAMPRLIEQYGRVGLADNLNEQWLVYQTSARNEPLPIIDDGSLDIAAYWQGMFNRVPGIAAIAKLYIYFPVTNI